MFVMQTGVELSRGCEQDVRMGIQLGSSGVSWRVSVRMNGNPVDLTGKDISCGVRKGDGTSVQRIAGTAGDGYAEVALTSACFDTPGETRLVLRAEDEDAGERITLAVMNCYVLQ